MAHDWRRQFGSLNHAPGGSINRGFTSFLAGGIGPVPIAFLLVLVGAGALDLWLHASGPGLRLRAVGFDEQSAKRSGVRTTWVKVRALVLSALLATVASFFVMARSGIGNAQIGDSYALSSITAAVSLARWPSLSSCLPTLSPLASRWTMNAPIPLCRSSGFSVAKIV